MDLFIFFCILPFFPAVILRLGIVSYCRRLVAVRMWNFALCLSRKRTSSKHFRCTNSVPLSLIQNCVVVCANFDLSIAVIRWQQNSSSFVIWSCCTFPMNFFLFYDELVWKCVRFVAFTLQLSLFSDMLTYFAILVLLSSILWLCWPLHVWDDNIFKSRELSSSTYAVYLMNFLPSLHQRAYCSYSRVPPSLHRLLSQLSSNWFQSLYIVFPVCRQLLSSSSETKPQPPATVLPL